MDVLRDLVSLVGVATIGTGIIVLISYLVHGCKNLCRIVRDYKHMNEGSSYHYALTYMNNEIKRLNGRLHTVERVASNTNLHLMQHAKDYKHTKTAKKVAIDKERKKAEQESQHDSAVRGCGDGM